MSKNRLVWNSIASAPTDGTRVLLDGEDIRLFPQYAKFLDGEWVRDDGAEYIPSRLPNPTHWMDASHRRLDAAKVSK